MAVEIRRVESKRDLKKFIRFNYELYKNNAYSVPDLYEDMLSTFSKKKIRLSSSAMRNTFLPTRKGSLWGAWRL